MIKSNSVLAVIAAIVAVALPLWAQSPTVSIEPGVQLSWPSNANSYVVVEGESLNGPWIPSLAPVTWSNDVFKATVVPSEPARFFRLQQGIQFLDDFSVDRDWDKYFVWSCQTSLYSVYLANGAYHIEQYAGPGCGANAIQLSPFAPAQAFANVSVSVDLVGWSGGPRLSFWLRGHITNPQTGYGYMAALSTESTTYPGDSALWIWRRSPGFNDFIGGPVPIPLVNPNTDYRLVCSFVGSQLNLQLFDLSDLQNPVGSLAVSDSTLTQGNAGFRLVLPPGSAIHLDNFRFSGTLP